MTNFSANLNESQALAVNHGMGPILVLAGAGTGKTRVLTHRIARLVAEKHAWPSEILAVTFTNKAANEMKLRLQKILEENGQKSDITNSWIGTFHSIAAKILRIHAEKVGFDNNFTIIDFDDQIRIVKSISSDLGIDVKQYPAKLMLATIQKWKDLALTPEKVPSHEKSEPNSGKAFKIYEIYQRRLKSLGAMDFGDLLLHCLNLFLNNFEVLEQFQRKFKYILVDEYQDTNVAQYLWLKILSQYHKNICCVGDDDQSIYGWRGAEIGNILRFEKDFENALIVKLEQNYRSTNNILSAASCLISHNQSRLGKTLFSEKGEGEKIKIVKVHDGRDEARFIADEIEKYRSQNFKLQDMAILVRAGFQTRTFEECFLNRGINYNVVGGLKFYDRLEIRDVIAFIRIANNRNDDLAIERVINKPKRGIGQTTIAKIRNFAQMNDLGFLDAAINLIEQKQLKGKSASEIFAFNQMVSCWQENFQKLHHLEALEKMLDDSGYEKMWEAEKSIEATTRLENIKELKKAIAEFDNVTEFLEHISLVSEMSTNENGEQEDAVKIMTMHAAKGLEFEIVFLPGFEQGLFPSQRSIDDGNIEEERRLAYVAMTRAKQLLFLCFTSYRRIFNRTTNSIVSMFLNEIPELYCEQIDEDVSFASTLAKRPLHENSVNFIEQVPSDGLQTGAKVVNSKFGQGQIISRDGDVIEIFFQEHGLKKIKSTFIELVDS